MRAFFSKPKISVSFQQRIAWLTDTHLDRLQPADLDTAFSSLASSACDAFLFTGDISNATLVSEQLEQLADLLKKPIYFVLGNHDYYHGRVAEVRSTIKQLCQQQPLLHYLGTENYLDLDPDTALLGQDCWADARLGHFEKSSLLTRMRDAEYIQDLSTTKTIAALKTSMQTLADADAEALRQQIEAAVAAGKKTLLIAVHVPPFAEVCLEKEGGPDDHLPFFTSKVVGDLLLEFAKAHPAKQFIVFCGHTHVEAAYQPAANLQVFCGAASSPELQIQDLHQRLKSFQPADSRGSSCLIL